MKVLGRRYEWDELPGKSFVIVELENFEFEALKELLETRDLAAEEQVKRAWVKGFNAKVRKLSLDAFVGNMVLRGSSWGCFKDADGNLMSFEAWREAVLDAFEEHGKRGHTHPPVENIRNMGPKSYIKLVDALKAAQL